MPEATLPDDPTPNLNTLRIFEDEGRKFRFYLTIGGNIACDRFDSASKKWKPVSMREATEAEINEMLSVRYATKDEEIARTVAKYHK
jgi:hypothetical protein